MIKSRLRELKIDAKGHTVSWQQIRNKNAMVMGRINNEETVVHVTPFLNHTSSHPFICNVTIHISSFLSYFQDILESSEPFSPGKYLVSEPEDVGWTWECLCLQYVHFALRTGEVGENTQVGDWPLAPWFSWPFVIYTAIRVRGEPEPGCAQESVPRI